MIHAVGIAAIVAGLGPFLMLDNQNHKATTADLEFFEKKVRPVLANNCSICHSAETKPAGGLRVDDRNGLLVGGNNGPSVVPGKPDDSLLIKRIVHVDPKRRMPAEGKPLTDEEVKVLRDWIARGAHWPQEKPPAADHQLAKEYEELKKSHWAWQPISNPKIPQTKDEVWPASEIDRFVLSRLESENLQPVKPATRAELIRRLSFDLTGLPPTPEDANAFVNDSSNDAYVRLVDRLLSSPGYGEKWARHWLDVARYGESTGPSRNIPYPHSWKYRDYVIKAIEADVPYDRFLTEQIAGDLLPAASEQERDRLLTATGFLALGVKDVNQRFKVRFEMDNVDEQIDVVTRSTVGLTVSCARCHDHKYDPIPQTDYYALAGIFTSTENCAGLRNRMGGGGLEYYDQNALLILSSAPKHQPNSPEIVKQTEEVAEAKNAWDAIRGTKEGLTRGPNGRPVQQTYRVKYEKLRAELLLLTDPASQGHAVHGVRDAKQVADTPLRIRGEAERHGPVVPRGFLTAFTVPDATPVNSKQSGRLELARWITNPKHPLTARVAVNRVWSHLFGRGIVSTVDNFGVNGVKPSHPELLDHLASSFINDQWSLKRLIRRLVLSRTYQLSSSTEVVNVKRDPSNQLLWRHSPRRLEAEEFRDALLLASGQLKRGNPGSSEVAKLKMMEMRDNGLEAKGLHESANSQVHRSIYLPALRGIVPSTLAAFDPVDQTLVTPQRDATSVPSQALFVLNSTFVRQQSLLLAKSVLADSTKSPEEKIQFAFKQLLNREATVAEVSSALHFVDEYQQQVPKAQTVLASADLKKIKDSAATDSPAIEATKKQEPANPDEVDQTPIAITESEVNVADEKQAAWLALVQALVASAEFRFIK